MVAGTLQHPPRTAPVATGGSEPCCGGCPIADVQYGRTHCPVRRRTVVPCQVCLLTHAQRVTLLTLLREHLQV